MIDQASWDGVNILLDDYANVRAGDTVIVAYTPDSVEVTAWVYYALSMRDIQVARLRMNPIQDEDFPGQLASVLPDPSDMSGRLIILTFERDTLSHTEIFRNYLSPYPNDSCVFIRAISACPTLFSHALHALPHELSARNTTLLHRCMSAKVLHIESPGGTDLSVTLDTNRYRWISNRGFSRPGGCIILPAGEVATFPASADGVLVADFAFNINTVTERDARLGEHPVTVAIEKGRAVHWECDDPEIQEFLDEFFQDSLARNVGELGFGTNFRVTDAIPLNSHINERKTGVHIGFGQHNQDSENAGYYWHKHLDLIANGGLVWIDDDPNPLDLSHIAPSTEEHPVDPHDEDVFSPDETRLANDCCGILGTMSCDV